MLDYVLTSSDAVSVHTHKLHFVQIMAELKNILKNLNHNNCFSKSNNTLSTIIKQENNRMDFFSNEINLNTSKTDFIIIKVFNIYLFLSFIYI